MKNKKIILLVVPILILIAATIALLLNNSNKDKNKNKENVKEKEVEELKEKTKNIKIVDLNSNSRPYAVMINNIDVARPYQSGLDDAYIVYEMIVEGGITRMMALFKDKDTKRIGSVRSSRHYYLDYALENDAIYVHFGWSPQAQSDISTLKINNINGLYDDAFWREDLNVAYEHTAFTSIEKIEKVAKKKNYRMTTDAKLLLDYSEDELDLSAKEDKVAANTVSIKYSNSYITSYKYNDVEKVYYRSVNNNAHTDYSTKKQYTAKNIIIAYVNNGLISNDNKGRQELENIGTGTGYYITNGVAIPITWEKASRSAQTIYKYNNGEKIVVNDGNTYIQIAPKDSATIK